MNQVFIYEVKDYSNAQWNQKTLETNQPIKQVDIKDISKVLKSDKGFNIRIHDNENCIVYGDVDHYKTEELFNDLIGDLADHFDIEKEMVSYTYCKKGAEHSYHFAIPTIESNLPTLKKLFGAEGRFAKYSIDLAVYKNGWFRLPNQSNINKPLKHKIIRGEMRDFIVQYTLDAEHNYFDDTATLDYEDKKKAVERPKSDKARKANYNEVEKIVDLISLKRLEDYSQWLNIGFAIYDELQEEGLDIFLNYSSKYKNYNEQKDTATYLAFKNKKEGVTIGTLKYYAKQDNLTSYLKLNPYIFTVDTSTGAIGDYFKKLYGDEFVYCNDTLYSFNKVYWIKDDKKLSILNNFVDSVFFNILFKQYQDYEAANINDAGLRNKIDGIRKAILNIRNHKKRKEYIDDIICKITNNNVKFDEKAHLFAFNNMIYNTQLMQFTKPDPLDYISMTTGYNYNEEYDNKKVVELETLINTILKEPTIKAFYMQILATGLIGQNLEKFVVCSGVGGNGKGLINGLAMAMFGSGSNNYSYKLKSSVLSEALKVGSNPEVANCHNKRFIVAQEPERDAKIKVSIMKELTGDDNINARLNHSNETNTKIKATLVLECNSKPKFDEIDDAVFRRLITVLFKSKFVDASMYDKEDETIDGIIDNKYKSQVWKDDYKQALFNIIIKHLETYNKNGLILPEEIINHNKKYMQESDSICEFIDENYIKTDNKSDKIPLKEVFNHYKIENTKEKYKDFRAQIEKNLFLKKHIIINKDDTYILMGYKLKDQIDSPLD